MTPIFWAPASVSSTVNSVFSSAAAAAPPPAAGAAAAATGAAADTPRRASSALTSCDSSSTEIVSIQSTNSAILPSSFTSSLMVLIS